MKNVFLKGVAMLMSVAMIGAFAVGCGKEQTYTEEDFETMSNEELEELLESKISELEEEEELPESKESDGIDIWQDVEVTFDGVNGFSFVNIEYVGDNQIIKDNVQFYPALKVAEAEDPSFVVFCPYTGEKFWVAAVYDEQAMEDAGIKIKKYIDTDRDAKDRISTSSVSVKEATDIYPVVVPELPAHYIPITDETDVTMFYEAIESVSKRIKHTEIFKDEDKWVLNENIHPVWAKLLKMEKAGCSQMEIVYADENGLLCGSVIVTDVNMFYDNGEWCKKIFEAIPDAYVNLGIDSYINKDTTFEEWSENLSSSVCFEIK